MIDPHHIAAFLRSQEFPEAAETVLNMHNRLEAFAAGLDRDVVDVLRRAQCADCPHLKDTP